MVVMESCFVIKIARAQRSTFNIRSTITFNTQYSVLIDCYSSQTWQVSTKNFKRKHEDRDFIQTRHCPQHTQVAQRYLAAVHHQDFHLEQVADKSQGAWFGQSDLSPDQTLTWPLQAIVASSVTVICSDERSSGERSNDERIFACSLTPR